MSDIPTTVSTLMRGTPESVFDHVVPIDLRSIFQGYGRLPAVVGSADQTGGWDAPGQTRRVILSDGGSALEQLTHYDRPQYFAYRVSELTGPFGLLVQEAKGEWWFDQAGLSTSVKWRYTLTPRSALTWPVLKLVSLMWRQYMRRALELCRVGVEGAGYAA